MNGEPSKAGILEERAKGLRDGEAVTSASSRTPLWRAQEGRAVTWQRRGHVHCYGYFALLQRHAASHNMTSATLSSQRVRTPDGLCTEL